ncbi:MAG: hypothetical protein WCY09_09600 [Candidatus Omnitrophota bacterium]|jgi:hypothetical protein
MNGSFKDAVGRIGFVRPNKDGTQDVGVFITIDAANTGMLVKTYPGSVNLTSLAGASTKLTGTYATDDSRQPKISVFQGKIINTHAITFTGTMSKAVARAPRTISDPSELV